MNGETPRERRDRLRAETAGLSEYQLLHREDEAFARSKHVIQAGELAIQAAELAEARQRDLEERTAQATKAVRAKGDAHRRRAAELHAEGLSAARIGVRIAHEEQRSEPYSERLARPT